MRRQGCRIDWPLRQPPRLRAAREPARSQHRQLHPPRLALIVWIAALGGWSTAGSADAACQSFSTGNESTTWPSELQVAQDPTARPADAGPVERRKFRIVWGGSTPRTWQGRIQVRGARIVQMTPLGMLPDSAGVSDSPQEIRIRSRFASTFNGLDVELEGTSGGVLQVQMASRESSAGTWQQEIPLGNVWRDHPHQVTLDDVGSRLAISRVPGDTLGVDVQRDNLVFGPGERFPLRVETRGITATAAAQGLWQVVCRRSGSTQVVWSRQWDWTANAEGLIPPLEGTELAVPDAEGVYDLHVELVEPSGFSLLRHDRVVATRLIQFVVVAATNTAAADSAAWVEQYALDPTRPERWTLRRQFNALKLPQRSTPPLGEGARVVAAGPRQVLELAPKGWQVYTLPIETPGMPHLVEIDYGGSHSIALGVSLLEENAAGQIPLSGFDVGVFIPHSVAESAGTTGTEPRWHTHRFVVWPTSKSPRLALTNHDESHAALLGSIRILTGPARLSATSSPGIAPPSIGAAEVERSAIVTGHRQRWLYVHRPNLGDLLGAPAVWDRDQKMQLDDWNTIYTAADRLVQFLQAQGYDGMVLTVAAEGSAIYPSRALAANPRWDQGAFFATGQDPVRKDVVELLYRMFDRAGLTLVPAVELSGLLPALERGLEFGVDDSVLLQTARGVQDLVRADPAEFRPPYNPLSPTVQQAVATVVEEIAARGSSHGSYRGLAILLNGRSVLALNADDWGCDPTTWEQFTRDVGWAATTAVDESRNRETILREHRESWLAWRSERLTRFLEQLGRAVQNSVPGGQLYLLVDEESGKSGIDIATLAYSPTQAAGEPRPLRWGLPWDRLRTSTWLTCVPIRNSSWWRSPLATPLPAAAPESREARGGQMVFHQASWAEFAQLADRQVFPRHQGEILRLQQFAPGGKWAQSHIATGLAESDPLTLVEGGWSLAQTWAEPGSGPGWALRMLPAIPFDPVPSTATQPFDCVVVRQAATSDAAYFYAANLTPWPVEIELATNGSERGLWQLLSARTPDQLQQTTRATVRLQLAEFEVVAATGQPSSQVNGYRVVVPNQAAAQMQYEIVHLKSKLFNGSPAAQRLPLANADFELPRGDRHPATTPIPGWQLLHDPASEEIPASDWTATLDSLQPFEGTQSLRLSGDQGSVQLASDLLPGSQTGRVMISAAVRQSGAPQLELTLTGSFGGQDITRTRRVALPDTLSEWQAVAIRFNDLPGELSDVRLRWTIRGSGSLWLDRVEVQDYWLDDEETKALKQLINLASYKLNEQGDLLGCLRILESYWPRFIDRHYLDRVETADAESTGTTLK